MSETAKATVSGIISTTVYVETKDDVEFVKFDIHTGYDSIHCVTVNKNNLDKALNKADEVTLTGYIKVTEDKGVCMAPCHIVLNKQHSSNLLTPTIS
jgi:hypothetical protein